MFAQGRETIFLFLCVSDIEWFDCGRFAGLAGLACLCLRQIKCLRVLAIFCNLMFFWAVVLVECIFHSIWFHPLNLQWSVCTLSAINGLLHAGFPVAIHMHFILGRWSHWICSGIFHVFARHRITMKSIYVILTLHVNIEFEYAYMCWNLFNFLSLVLRSAKSFTSRKILFFVVWPKFSKFTRNEYGMVLLSSSCACCHTEKNSIGAI